jgi:hypothetical protein
LAPPADKGKRKHKDTGKVPPRPRAPKPRPAGTSGSPGRPPAGARRKPPARANIRDAAAQAAERRATEKQETSDAAGEFEDAPTSAGRSETNGHSRWPDHTAETDSWDAWDDGDRDAPRESANRTLAEWLDAVVPPDAQLHFLAAAQEFAAGVQTTIDHHLHPEDQGDDGGAGALRIDIE